MGEDLFRKLQQRLDKYSIGFPATESGIEITILKRLFSEADATLFMAMSPKLETPAQVAERLGRPVEDVAAQLEAMTDKGLLFRLKKGDQGMYGAIPFIHGLFEFQVANLDKELAAMVEEYLHDPNFEKTMQKSAGAFLRTVPVGRSVPVEHHVASFDDARQLLAGVKQIVVTDCICRKHQKTLGGGCDKQLEACFMFGSMGQYYLDRNMGRKVSLEEAVEILEKCREAGLVTQPGTAQNPAGMCNCCGDCCGVLRTLNKHPKPAELVFSNHFAQVDAGECTGCETCLDRCQMGAIAINDDSLAVIDLDRCIGCGLCVTTCPTEAISLIPKAEGQLKEPPVTSADQMRYMAQVRGLI